MMIVPRRGNLFVVSVPRVNKNSHSVDAVFAALPVYSAAQVLAAANAASSMASPAIVPTPPTPAIVVGVSGGHGTVAQVPSTSASSVRAPARQ
jgi:hypothetical protein